LSNIVFHTIRYANFLSTGDESVEIQLDRAGTTLIVGTNGSGKSTFLDALSFALFGKPFRRVKRDQLVNTITRRNLRVELEFSVGESTFRIVRGIRPNVFEVYLNGSLLNQTAAVRDYQEALEKNILRCTHRTFCQVVVLGSASYVPFMELPAWQRRQVIEDLLDLDIFTRMNTLLRDRSAAADREAVENHARKTHLIERIRLAKERIAEARDRTEHAVSEKRVKLETVWNEITSLDKDIAALSMTLYGKREEAETDAVLERRLAKLEKLRAAIEANRDRIKRDIEFFDTNDTCPTCGQPIDEEHKRCVKSEKAVEVAAIEQGLTLLVEQYDENRARADLVIRLNREIAGMEMDHHRLMVELGAKRGYAQELVSDINRASSNHDSVDMDALFDLEEELEGAQAVSRRIDEDREAYAAAGSLLRDDGIKARIVRNYVPVINNLITKYLAALDFMCSFELDENFVETIRSRYRDDFTYESFSAGERLRITLAVLFAWRSLARLRCSVSTNLLVLDEILDSSLDDRGSEEFLKLISQLSEGTNTFIISHNTTEIVDKFDRVLSFTKVRNFSSYTTLG
jgi:DNA repair exonuclease SbcCD ATPase subunit